MSKKEKITIRKQKWGKKTAIVVVKNGKVQTYTYDKISVATARERYKRQNTLRKDITARRLKVSGRTTQFIFEQNSSIKNRKKATITKKPSKNAQYFVSGYVNGKYIIASSQKIGAEYSLVNNAREAKRSAWESFLERVSEVTSATYDADEGLKQIDSVKNIKEGWSYYVKR